MTIFRTSNPSTSITSNAFSENTPFSSNLHESRSAFVENQHQRITAVYHRVRSFSVHSGSIRSLIFCKNGSIVSASKKVNKVWSPETGQVYLKLSNRVLFKDSYGSSSSDKAMARFSASIDDRMIIYRLRKLADESIATILYSNEKSRFVSISSNILIWNPHSGQFLYRLDESPDNHADNRPFKIHEAIELPKDPSISNGCRLATINSRDNYITDWSLNNNRSYLMNHPSSRIQIQGHQRTITAMCLLKDGGILTASLDKTLKIWDVNTKKCLTTFQRKQAQWVIFVEELNTTRLVSISYLGNVEIWDRKQEITIDSFKINSGKLVFCQLLSKGWILSINEQRVAEIWDLETHSCLQQFDDSQYCSATESPSGDLLLGDRKGVVSIFSPKDKDPIEKARIGEEDFASKVNFSEGKSVTEGREIREAEGYLSNEEDETTPSKDSDLDSSELSDKSSPEKPDHPEVCVDETSDSIPERTDVFTSIDSDSKSSTIDTTVEEDSLPVSVKKATVSQASNAEQEVSISTSDAVFIKMNVLVKKQSENGKVLTEIQEQFDELIKETTEANEEHVSTFSDVADIILAAREQETKLNECDNGLDKIEDSVEQIEETLGLIEDYLGIRETREVIPHKDSDLDSSKPSPEKPDHPEVCVNETSDSIPERTNVFTSISSDSKSSTVDTTVKKDSLSEDKQKASTSLMSPPEADREEKIPISPDAVFIEISELGFDAQEQIKSAITAREQTLEQEMQKVESTLKELRSFEKTRREDQAKVDAFIHHEAVSLKTELESTQALVSELQIWKEEQESTLQVLLKKKSECMNDLKKLEEYVEQHEEAERSREQARIDEQLTEKREAREKLEELIKQQQEQKRLLDEQCKLYSQEIKELQSNHKLIADQQITQNEKLKPIYAKYLSKEKILKEQQKLTSSKEVNAFYKTLEEELGKKLQASILLTSGLLQRSAVKKDYLAGAAGYAVEGVFAFVAGMISIGTLGTSTLIIGTAAAVAGAAAGKSTEELVAARIDKKYENRAQEVSAAMCNPKYAWTVAELVARRITKPYLSELKKNSLQQNQVWATKAANVLYLFIASGKLKEKNSKTEDDMISALIEVLEEHLKAEKKRKNIENKKKCEIL